MVSGTMARVLAAFVAAAVAAAATDAKPDHVLFILVDDYGFADASYKGKLYNGTAAPQTPTLDKLADAGIKLESYYVNKLCSPTRTALLSGRYAYTIGMDDGVIVGEQELLLLVVVVVVVVVVVLTRRTLLPADGQNIDLPLNLYTIADHLKMAGWNTSAYGKWDAGCTVWGSTPTCRGFDHFNGFYSAASDYYTHQVGAGFDYHLETHRRSAGDFAAYGDYTTHRVTSAVQVRWCWWCWC